MPGIGHIDEDTDVIERDAAHGFATTSRSLVIFHHDGVELVSLVPNVPTTVGRALGADVVVRGERLSRRHARFELVDGDVWVHDLGSTNGTIVSGIPLTRPVVAGFDDLIELGSVVVQVAAVSAEEERSFGVANHDRFVEWLEDELVRARTFGRQAALLLVHAGGGGGEAPQRWLPDVRATTRQVDRVGLYGPQIAEVCRAEADHAEAVALARRLVEHRSPTMPVLRCGVAVFPDAGRTVDELLAAAWDALRATTPEAPYQVAGAFRQVSLLAHEGARPVVRSPTMVELYRRAERIAPASAPVLVLGERGTGKVQLARTIHARGGRGGFPLHVVNLEAIPEDAQQQVLFGGGEGETAVGVLEAADGATVLLDEIGALALPAQVTLARFLENRRLPGSDRALDIRVVAASSHDLHARARIGRFHPSLLARLETVTLEVPPLRERLSEIPTLANHFVQQAAVEYGRGITGLAPRALAQLLRYHWPGNVRQLRNVLRRAVLVTLGEQVEVEDLPARLQALARAEAPARERPTEIARAPESTVRETVPMAPRRGEGAQSLSSALRACETALIRRAHRLAHGNPDRAAEILGVSARTLSYKLHDYGLDPRRPDPVGDALLARVARPGDVDLSLEAQLARIEQRLLAEALERTGNDLAAAARRLGLHPRALRAKLDQHELLPVDESEERTETFR